MSDVYIYCKGLLVCSLFFFFFSSPLCSLLSSAFQFFHFQFSFWPNICPHSMFQAAVFLSPDPGWLCTQRLSCASPQGSCGTSSVSQCSSLSYASIWGISCSVHSHIFFPVLNSCQTHVKYSGKCCLLRAICLSSFGDDSYSCQLFLFVPTVAQKILLFQIGNSFM